MSVGIVAKYPWEAISNLGIKEPPCVFIFTDSRVSNNYGPIDNLRLAKQRVFSDNLIVCYTSSNIYVTTSALDRVEGAPTTSGIGSTSTHRDVRRIGKFIAEEHKKYGGITELIAVIWQKHYPAPQMFDVMPPKYEPEPRQGGIGIGDDKVLSRFKELFRNPPPGVLQMIESAELLKSYPSLLEKIPLETTLPPVIPSFEAAAEPEIGAALTQAIEEVNSTTVGYPLEINRMTKQGIVPRGMSIRRIAIGRWERLTAGQGELTLPRKSPKVSKRLKGRNSAVQLFP